MKKILLMSFALAAAQVYYAQFRFDTTAVMI